MTSSLCMSRNLFLFSLVISFHVYSWYCNFSIFHVIANDGECERPYNRIRLTDCRELGIRWWSTCKMTATKTDAVITLMTAMFPLIKCVTRDAMKWWLVASVGRLGMVLFLNSYGIDPLNSIPAAIVVIMFLEMTFIVAKSIFLTCWCKYL